VSIELEKGLEATRGYLTLDLLEDAWIELDSIPPELRAHEAVIELRIQILLKFERWKFARVLAESQAKRLPENPAWWLHWAYALRRERSIIDARGVLWEAAQRHPACALIQYNLACYAAVLGETDEAKVLLAKAILLDDGLRAIAIDDPDLELMFGSL
jgi:predicted Zn-dependent protease